MKKFAIILSGCGNKDGTELRESILSMLVIEQRGYSFDCFAPNVWQEDVINHMTNEKMTNIRNVLIESSRIARGDIKSLEDLCFEDYSAILFPGGYGVAKNLTNFGYVNDNSYTINNAVSTVIQNFHMLKKPMGFLCIAPILVQKIIPDSCITLGNDKKISSIMESIGSRCKIVDQNVPIVDRKNRIVSLPCYMLDISIPNLYNGIQDAIKEIINLI